MSNVTHGSLAGSDLHVPGYVDSVDPMAVGAGKLWIDTNSGTSKWAIKIRKSDNSGWEAVYNPAAVAITGGTITGVTITDPTITLANGVSLRAKDGGGVSRSLMYYHPGNFIVIGGGAGSGSISFYSGSNSATMNMDTSRGVTVYDAFAHQGPTLGFYGATATSKPTVSGSRGSNAALTSLCTALADLGLITNSTS